MGREGRGVQVARWEGQAGGSQGKRSREQEVQVLLERKREARPCHHIVFAPCCTALILSPLHRVLLLWCVVVVVVVIVVVDDDGCFVVREVLEICMYV